jgi:hypothetical protein
MPPALVDAVGLPVAPHTAFPAPTLSPLSATLQHTTQRDRGRIRYLQGPVVLFLISYFV